MLRICCILLSCLLFSACVTETTVNGEERSAKQLQGNKLAAAKTRITLALRYLEAGDVEQAKRNLDLAETLAPKMIEVYIAQAHFYQQVEQFERAIDAYEKARRISPKNGDMLNNYGVMLCRQGDYAEADKLFQTALNNIEYVEVAATNENAGICALQKGDKQQALDYFNKALAYNLYRPNSLLSAAEIMLELQDYTKVRQYLNNYDSIRQASPRSLFAWLQLEQAEDNFAAEAKIGLELQRLFPNAVQTKRYKSNDY